MDIITIIGYVIAAILWGTIGFFWYKKTLTEKAKQFKIRMSKAREIEEDILEKAKEKADEIREKAEEKAQNIEEKRMEKMAILENKILEREEKLDQKLEKIEQSKEALREREKEIDEIIKEQNNKLAEIAKLTPEQAKQELLDNIEKSSQTEIKSFIDKRKMIKKEESEKEAAQIIARSLPKMAGEATGEFTSVLVDIPNEDFKGKLIGREGRNINYFEKITGAELIVDDTPLVVRLSCYDHEKRFIARTTLERLIKDGKINPVYIEKLYNEVLSELDTILLEKGKEALTILNLTMMKPEIVKLVWQFYLRYSYGQNLRNHSIEVAKISEAIAIEMGEDPLLAKKAGLLHDIGKIQATTWQSHTKVWGEILRKYSMDDTIINAAESHHYDIPMTNTISRIVTAADGISASRPGARFNTKELFIEKMGELESTVNSVEGIDKVHIMQAWREIMVYVDPKKISDDQLENVLKQIANNIEEKLDYPWIIRVAAIRESKIVDYIK